MSDRRQVLLANIDEALTNDYEAQKEVRRAKRKRKKTLVKFLEAHKELNAFDKMKLNEVKKEMEDDRD